MSDSLITISASVRGRRINFTVAGAKYYTNARAKGAFQRVRQPCSGTGPDHENCSVDHHWEERVIVDVKHFDLNCSRSTMRRRITKQFGEWDNYSRVWTLQPPQSESWLHD